MLQSRDNPVGVKVCFNNQFSRCRPSQRPESEAGTARCQSVQTDHQWNKREGVNLGGANCISKVYPRGQIAKIHLHFNTPTL